MKRNVRFRGLSAIILGLGLLLTAQVAWADAPAKSAREKNLDFEDEVVEGMNKRPLDSVSQLGEEDRRRRKAHLYRKRPHYQTEMAELAREAGYTP